MQKQKKLGDSKQSPVLTPLYTRDPLTSNIPKYEIPKGEMLPDTAYNLIKDELMLDGNARLNLATFVTTWMEPEVTKLLTETFEKNMIDKDEYPQTAEIEMRCVNIISRLWNSPENEIATGTSTIGSSEASMLGGMALKWKWREKMRAAGKPTDKPNMVMGINVQICWDKFCTFWDIEPRFVPMEKGRYIMDAEQAAALCDENTIGVVAIMGSTFEGSYEPVKEINDALDKLQKEKGLDIPIHVDGASGGFVAPFLQPDLEWDFRVPRVQSINTSGHKYGLVYPGIGWIIWRTEEALPEELIFRVNYLGGDMPTFAINFSRPGNYVVAQYYNFLRLGFEGYRRIHQASQDVALYLSAEIAKLGPFDLLSDGSDIPVFAFKLKDKVLKSGNYTVFDLSDRLRQRGWQVPAYTFPKNCENIAALRVVVKEGFSRDLADMLLEDLRRHIEWFDANPSHKPTECRTCFGH
ncbi:MAG TPA: glutamate decarboxylase [Thermodesulfobacteriota bacterium]|nr:glutamate decarboxylase [Thermodesulfobacteriota bacterium]